VTDEEGDTSDSAWIGISRFQESPICDAFLLRAGEEVTDEEGDTSDSAWIGISRFQESPICDAFLLRA
jgi:phosphohistidine swiveling domain-containing protein